MVGAFQVAHEPRFGELDEQRHGEPWDTRSFGVVESDDGAAVAVVDAEVDGGNVGDDVGSDDDELDHFDRRVVRHPQAAGESVDPLVLVERPHDSSYVAHRIFALHSSGCPASHLHGSTAVRPATTSRS
jgi:hypothetical protein